MLPTARLLLLLTFISTLWSSLNAIIYEDEATASTAKRLVKSLLKNYDSYLHPFESGEKTATIHKQAIFDQNYVFVEETRQIHFDTTILYEWFDDRLQWNNTAFPNVDVVRMDPEDIWKPSIFVSNENVGDELTIKKSKAMVLKNGKVHFIFQESISLKCFSVNFECTKDRDDCQFAEHAYTFPTDRYFCYYNEYLEKHETASYDIKKDTDNPTACINDQCLLLINHDDLETDMLPKKWSILSLPKPTKFYSYPDSFYVMWTSLITIQRNDVNRFHLYVIPSGTLSFLLIVQFLLPCSSKARLLSNAILLCNLVAQMVELSFEISVRLGGGGVIVHYIATLIILNALTFGLSALMSSLWVFGVPSCVIPYLKRLNDNPIFAIVNSVFLIPPTFEKDSGKGQERNESNDEAHENFFMLCRLSIFIDRCFFVIGFFVALVSVIKLSVNIA